MTPAQLRARLLAREELALLDVREQGVHYTGHPFFACSLPLSRLDRGDWDSLKALEQAA